jgi:hypothetical protein
MPTPEEQKIINELNSMPLTAAREAIAIYKWGHKGTDGYTIASDWLTDKEAALRDAREDESLSISRKALEISEEANRIAEKAKSSARSANIIAIIAIVLSTTTAIIAIIITLLTEN